MVSKIRRFFQYISAVAIDNYVKGVLIGEAIYQGFFKKIPAPALNCYSCPLSRFACPIGTFQHFLTLRQVPYFMLGFFGFIGGLIGRAPCGWICPFGLIQELLYKIPSYKIHLPEWVKYIKYVVLVVLLVLFISCAPKTPPVVLPKWEPLPEVKWKQGANNTVCTEDFDNLKKREELRNLRETTYLEMLKAMGAIEAPK